MSSTDAGQVVGTVMKKRPDKQFGFISYVGDYGDEESIFFHLSEVKPDDVDNIYNGCKVAFTLADSHERGKKKATKISITGKAELFDGVIDSIGSKGFGFIRLGSTKIFFRIEDVKNLPMGCNLAAKMPVSFAKVASDRGGDQAVNITVKLSAEELQAQSGGDTGGGSQGGRLTGFVSKFTVGKSFGFVTGDHNSTEQIFFHFSKLRTPDQDWDNLARGVRVEYTEGKGNQPGKKTALDVTILSKRQSSETQQPRQASQGGGGWVRGQTVAAPPPAPKLEAVPTNDKTSWKPSFKKSESKKLDPEIPQALKEIKSCLNKMSEKQFPHLSLKLKTRILWLCSPEAAAGGEEETIDAGLSDAFNLLFTKAQLEPLFTEMYARLMKLVGKDDGPAQSKFRSKLMESWNLNNSLTVHDMLMRMLAGVTLDPELAKRRYAEMSEELDEAKRAGAEAVEYADMTMKTNLAQRRVHGHVKFTGALFTVGIVSEKGVTGFVYQLMAAADKANAERASDNLAEALQRVCGLIEACGDKLCRSPTGLQLLMKCRAALAGHLQKGLCDSRIRFLIQV